MDLVCLACSHRPGGRCIAGIDLESGRWVRPVPRLEDAIPEARCRVGGTPLTPLDVLRITTLPLREKPRYQRENEIVPTWGWSLAGRLTAADVAGYVEEATPLLHSRTDRVDPALLEPLPAEDWRSLQLVRPRDLSFLPDSRNRDPWTPNRYRARFRDADGCEYALIVTDPQASRRLDGGGSFTKEVLLTVSLTKPYAAAPGHRPACFKVVAAVIEM